MAYEAGIANGRNDFLDKLRTFVLGLGWTVNKWEDLGATDKRLHIQNGTSYFNFRSCVESYPFDYYSSSNQYSRMTGICLQGSTGYDGGEDWDHQPGYVCNQDSSATDYLKSSGVAMQSVKSATFNYWFFSTDDFVSTVIEFQAGAYQHMMFGDITKFGTYTGGMFCAATFAHYEGFWNVTGGYVEDLDNNNRPALFAYEEDYYEHSMHMYLEIDGKTDWWCNGWKGGEYCSASGSGKNKHLITSGVCTDSIEASENLLLNSRLFNESPVAVSGVAPLLPIYVFASRSTLPTFSPAGVLPGVRLINMQYKNAEDEITFGADTWKIMPYFFKDMSTGKLDNVGIAYKK